MITWSSRLWSAMVVKPARLIAPESVGAFEQKRRAGVAQGQAGEFLAHDGADVAGGVEAQLGDVLAADHQTPPHHALAYPVVENRDACQHPGARIGQVDVHAQAGGHIIGRGQFRRYGHRRGGPHTTVRMCDRRVYANAGVEHQ